MSSGRVRLLAAAIVAVPLVGYPAVVLARGGAEFPSTDDCVRPAPSGSTEELDLVFGRRDTPAAANALLERVQTRSDARISGAPEAATPIARAVRSIKDVATQPLSK